ncbi:hypothetical protein A2U01_0055453, partial [Trifolium medium]|nr:hypothetical protein [Trifolium medium]
MSGGWPSAPPSVQFSGDIYSHLRVVFLRTDLDLFRVGSCFVGGLEKHLVMALCSIGFGFGFNQHHLSVSGGSKP